MTTEQIIAAEAKLDVMKNAVPKMQVSTELSEEDQIVYDTIPDEFKALALTELAVHSVRNPEYDIRLPLVQKGMVELWKRRNDIAAAYNTGYNARTK